MIRNKQKHKSNNFLKIIPIVATILIIFLLAWSFRNITIEEFLTYVPKDYFLAAITLIAFYPIKSLSVFFPLSILYFCAGFIFPFWISLVVTLIGLFAEISVPYLIGRKFGQGLITSLTQKYPKIDKVFQLGLKNELLVCYIMRIVPILSVDLCSLLLGACHINYWKYVRGSLLGLTPLMVVHLLIAQAVENRLTWQMIVVMIILLGVSIASSIYFNKRSNASTDSL